jgi:adenine-specific DNA-methyltransferase
VRDGIPYRRHIHCQPGTPPGAGSESREDHCVRPSDGSGGTEDIAARFIDTDYNEESYFVRHAYFLGANDPYKALKTTLKAEIDEEAWENLYRDVSRPFPKPSSGRIAVKVINHFDDDVMKVYSL